MLHILSLAKPFLHRERKSVTRRRRDKSCRRPVVESMEGRLLLTVIDTGLTGDAGGSYSDTGSVSPLDPLGDSYYFMVGEGASIDVSLQTPTTDSSETYFLTLSSSPYGSGGGIDATTAGQGTVTLPEQTGSRDRGYYATVTGIRPFSQSTDSLPYTMNISTGSGEPQVDLAITSAEFAQNNSILNYTYSAVNDPGPYTIRLYLSATDELPSPIYMYNPLQISPTFTAATADGSGYFDLGSPITPAVGDPYLVLYIIGNDPEIHTDNNVFPILISGGSKPSPTVTIDATPNPSTYGQAVTFKATVSPPSVGQPTPTGTVTFKEGPTVLNPGGTKLVSGAASYTTTSDQTLPAGTDTITAEYSGDSNFNSVSGSKSLTVNSPKPVAPSIVPTSLTRATDANLGPGVVFDYSVSGNLSDGANINFYWADGPKFENRFDNDPLAYSYAVNTPSRESPGIHGPIFVPRASFDGISDSSILNDATYLLAVTDNPDGIHNIVAMPLVVPITLKEIAQIVPPPPVPGPPPVKPANPTLKEPAHYKKLKKAWDKANSAYVTYNELSIVLVDFLNSNEAENAFYLRTSLRRAAFIGQVMHETAGLTQEAELPSKHASSKSKYSGRGFLQITGKANYQGAGDYLGVDLVDYPNLLVTSPMLGARASGWYWSEEHKTNKYADQFDIDNITILVNYGNNFGGQASLDSQHPLAGDHEYLLENGKFVYSYKYKDKNGKTHIATTTDPDKAQNEKPIIINGVSDRHNRSDAARKVLADFW